MAVTGDTDLLIMGEYKSKVTGGFRGLGRVQMKKTGKYNACYILKPQLDFPLGVWSRYLYLMKTKS